jgi:hypothetical protein
MGVLHDAPPCLVGNLQYRWRVFPNFLQLISRRAAPEYEQDFLHEVRPVRKRVRNPRVERLLALAWVLIALKSALVIWAVERYHIPFNPLWVIVPTVAFAGLCTLVYCRR